MTDETPKTKSGIKPLTKAFWALSRVRQEAFLKNLYDLSPENKALFALRLGGDKDKVFGALKKDLQKETVNRIGKFRKLRLAKINEILRNGEKYALPILQQIALKKEAWMGMLAFIISRRNLPERYQIACSRHLDLYLLMVQGHVLETSEVEDILTKDQAVLSGILGKGFYLPHIEMVYFKHFKKA
ncbi:MAG TPA: hypothetical protein VIT68_00135 [Candidatus Gracilibacteria bacterium]